jgi:hypothetical protein
MISVTFERQGHANWPFPSAGFRCWGWVYKTNIKLSDFRSLFSRLFLFLTLTHLLSLAAIVPA